MAFRGLHVTELPLPLGINTNFTARGQSGKTLSVAQNVDGFGVFQGIGKVPGSTRVSDDHGAPVTSLHYFEYFDLAGTFQRERLSVAGGALRRINADKSLTVLKATGLPSDRMVQVRMLDRLFLTSGSYVGVTGGLKYDGTNVRNWGIRAPGTTPTTKLGLDDHTLWSGSADAAKSNSTTSKDGNGSVQVDKTGTTTTEAYIERTGLSLDLSTAGDDEAFVWLFVPAGSLQKMATSGTAVEVRFGGPGLTDSDSHTFSIGDLVPGWNLLSMVLTAPSSTTGVGATLAAIDTVRLRLIFKGASETQTGFLWDRFHVQDEGKPTVAVGASGALSGTYSYRVTFLTENGVESNAGPPSSSITVTNQQVNLSAIPTSSDEQVIARRIYRDLDGDALYRFIAQIDDNTTTTLSDNVATPTSDTPPLAGDATLDASPPDPMKALVVHKTRVVGISADDPFILKMSDVGSPEQFRIIDELQIEDEAVALEEHAFGTLIYTTDKLFLLSGDGVNAPFRVDLVSTKVGANNVKSVAKVKSINVALRESEVFLILDPRDPWLLNGPVLDKFQALTNLTDAHIINDRRRFRVIFFHPSDAKAFVYQYGTLGFQQVTGDGSGTDPQDLRSGVWWELSLPATITPKCSEIVEQTADVPELWIGASDGYVYHLQDTAATDWAKALTTEPVNAIIETHPVPIGAPDGRAEPRYLHLEATSTGPATWTATVKLFTDAGGTEIASKQFTVSLPGGDASIIVPVPKIGARGEFASVRLENAVAGENGLFSRLALRSIPRTGFRGPRTA